MPATTLSNYERGSRVPTLPILERLAEAYGVSVERLLAPDEVGVIDQPGAVDDDLQIVQLTPEELELLAKVTELSEEGKREFAEVADRDRTRRFMDKVNGSALVYATPPQS